MLLFGCYSKKKKKRRSKCLYLLKLIKRLIEWTMAVLRQLQKLKTCPTPLIIFNPNLIYFMIAVLKIHPLTFQWTIHLVCRLPSLKGIQKPTQLTNLLSFFYSGLGDSISLPCLSADCSSSSSSVCGGSNTVNAVYSSCDSMSDSQNSPNNYQTMDSSQLYRNSQKQEPLNVSKAAAFLSSQKPASSDLSNFSQFGNYINQMSNLSLNQFDYDPFNDYMGIDKMVIQTLKIRAFTRVV